MKEEKLSQIQKEFFKILEKAEELGRTKADKLAIHKTREGLLQWFWEKSLKPYLKSKPDSDAPRLAEQVKEDAMRETRRLAELAKKYSPKRGAPERAFDFEKARDACAFAATLHGQGQSLKSALLDAADKFRDRTGKAPSLRTMYRVWKNRKRYFPVPE